MRTSNIIPLRREPQMTARERLEQQITLNSRRSKVEQIKAATADAVRNWREKQEAGK